MIQPNTVHEGDCLEVMRDIETKSVNMILCDLPYGTTAFEWDEVIPFAPLWEQYKRIIKDKGAIVLTASQPFTSALVMSNPEWFKYGWVWVKPFGRGHIHAKNKPLKAHEDVLIFSSGATNHENLSNNRMIYVPQNLVKLRKPLLRKYRATSNSDTGFSKRPSNKNTFAEFINYPKSVLEFMPPSQTARLHPTQKPLTLFEYLIRTYTNEGDLVLDNCAGSGTTGEACIRTNRDYILIEQEKEYIDVIHKRLATAQKPLFV